MFHREEGIRYYNSDEERERVLRQYTTVEQMMKEHRRSRSWAYQMIAGCPYGYILIHDIRTGKRERAITRHYVYKYLRNVRRGNPYW